MKASTPRWIAFGIIALMAAVSILTSYSPADQFIGTLIVLAYLFVGIMVGKEKTVISTAPAIAFGMLIFGCQIYKSRSLSVEYLGEYVTYIFENIVRLMEQSPLVLISIIALSAVQLFFRSSDNKLLIVLRYLALLFFFFATSLSSYMFQLLGLIALLGLSFELRTQEAAPERKHRILSSLYLWFLVHLAFQLHGFNLISVSFAGSAFSIYTIIGIGILAGLIIMEKHSDSEVAYLGAFGDVGVIALFWCGAALMMLLFPSLGNISVLVLLPIVMYHLYNIFMQAWGNTMGGTTQKTLFYIIWSLVCVLMLALAKSIYAQNILTAIFLAIAPVTAAICWSIAKKNAQKGGVQSKGQEYEIMVSFLGVIAVIALAVSTRIDASDPMILATFILSVAVLCVFWCLLSGRIYKLHRTASKVDADEFKFLAQIQKFAPLIVIIVALFKILLASPDA